MNPYLIVAALVALILAGAGGYYEGRHVGVTEQKVADQGQFDRINAEITANKAQATTQLAAVNAANMQIFTDRDNLKTALEKERAKNRIHTDDLHTQFSGSGLRFRTPEGAGRGPGGDGPGAPQADAPGAAGGALIQLPTTLASDLLELAYDADKLADDYRECKGYVDRVQ